MMRILVGSSLLVTLVHGVAWACSCLSEPRSAQDHLREDELVVWATVLGEPAPEPSRGCGAAPASNPSSGSTYEVELEVIEGFVGAEAGDVVSVAVAQGSSCAVTLLEGERWLVLLGPDEAIYTCNASHLAEDDDELLNELRAASSGG